MYKTLKLSELSDIQKAQFDQATTDAYSALILSSKVIQNYWDKLSTYFSSYQVSLISPNNELIGFINSVPIFWDQPLEELPDDGWDWLFIKAVKDHENGIEPNCLGGLQINILKQHQGQGYSKTLIAIGKKLVQQHNFKNFILPIRPTMKWKYPNMKMIDYLEFKINGKIYDPWIRAHLKEGAKIIKVCSNAMNISGDLKFWEKLLNQKLEKKVEVIVEGALNPVIIDPAKNFGEYREENIWINYDV